MPTEIIVPTDRAASVLSALSALDELNEATFPHDYYLFDAVFELLPVARARFTEVEDALLKLDTVTSGAMETLDGSDPEALLVEVQQAHDTIYNALDNAMLVVNHNMVPVLRECCEGEDEETREFAKGVQDFYATVDDLNYSIFDTGKQISDLGTHLRSIIDKNA